MKFFVGVTDNDWYKFLAELRPDELNFWRPRGGAFRAIEAAAFSFSSFTVLTTTLSAVAITFGTRSFRYPWLGKRSG
ncbi:hypothetical protein ACFLWA_12305 [Chloroflexota bacterium]